MRDSPTRGGGCAAVKALVFPRRTAVTVAVRQRIVRRPPRPRKVESQSDDEVAEAQGDPLLGVTGPRDVDRGDQSEIRLELSDASSSAGPRMEPLWSPVGANGGNRRQIEESRKPEKQAKTVAVGCDPLPKTFHGKEGVDGSSPSEGSHESPANARLSFSHFFALRPVYSGMEQILEQPGQKLYDHLPF